MTAEQISQISPDQLNEPNTAWSTGGSDPVACASCADTGVTEKHETSKKGPSWSAALGIALVLLISLHFFVFLVSAGIYAWNQSKFHEVQSSFPAGFVMRSDHSSSLFLRGSVETDTGFFFIEQPMSLFKGEAMNLEMRGSGDRYLCDSHNNCARVL
jgi:hypothetical protein